MRSALPALAILAVGLALAPTPAHGTCSAPQPEAPMMLTPRLTTLPAGSGAIVAYLSSGAGGPLTLSPEGARRGGPFAIQPVAIAPHVARFPIPAGITPGAYMVSGAYMRGTSTTAVELGVVSVGMAAPLPTPPAAPSGHLRRVTRPGRWAPSTSTELTLASAVPAAIGMLATWTVSGQDHGSAVWLDAQATQATFTSTGHCGGFPFDAVAPAARAHARVAFFDATGQVGPYADLTVE